MNARATSVLAARRTSGRAKWVSAVLASAVVAAGVSTVFIDGSFARLALLGGGALGAAALLNPSIGAALLGGLIAIQGGAVLEIHHGVPSPVVPLTAMLLLAARPWRGIAQTNKAPLVETVLWCAGYGTVLVASALVAADFAEAADKIERVAVAMAAAIAVAAVVAARRSVRPVIWGMIVGGLLVGVMVTHQSVTMNYSFGYFGLAQPDSLFLRGQHASFRAGGPFGDPNFFAQSMVVLVALAFNRLAHDSRTANRLVALAAVLVGTASIVFSASRGGFVGLLLVVVWSLFSRPRRRRLIVGTMIVAACAMPFVLQDLGSRLAQVGQVTELGSNQQPDDGAIRGRAAEMVAALQMFGDYPLLGVGVGNYKIEYQQYASTITLESRRTARSPHSLPLQVAAETGLVGLLMLGSIAWAAFNRLRRTSSILAEGRRSDEGLMLRGVAVALVGYLLCSVILHDAFPELMWLLLVIGVTSPTISRPSDLQQLLKDRRRDGRSPRPSSGVGTLLTS